MIKVSLLCRKTRALAPTQYLKESLSLGVIIERIMGNSNVPKTNKHNYTPKELQVMIPNSLCHFRHWKGHLMLHLMMMMI